MTVERVSNVDSVSAVLATCRGRRQTLVIDDILFALSCCMLLIKPSRDLNPTRHLFLQTNYGSSICNQFPSEYWILRQWTFHYSAHFCLAHCCEEWRYTFMMLALMFPRWRHFPFSTNSVIDTWIARYWFPLLNPVDRWLSSTSSPSADIRWSYGLAKIWWTIWPLGAWGHGALPNSSFIWTFNCTKGM